MMCPICGKEGKLAGTLPTEYGSTFRLVCTNGCGQDFIIIAEAWSDGPQ